MNGGEDTPKKALGYVRVSTDQQAQSGLGLEDQRKKIDAACTARGLELVAIHADEGKSGTTMSGREELKAVLKRLDDGEADVLVSSKLDRLARSTVDLAGILQQADLGGWSVVLLDLGVDTTTASGRLVAEVIGAVAAFESRQIGDRTSSALRVLKSQGKRLGRPSNLDREVAEQVVAFREQNMSYRAIAERMEAAGVPTASGNRQWHASTVQQVLRTVELDRQTEDLARG